MKLKSKITHHASRAEVLAEIKSLEIYDREDQEVENPFSKRTCILTPEAVALYDYINGVQIMNAGGMRLMVALEVFRTKWPKEYMILLD